MVNMKTCVLSIFVLSLHIGGLVSGSERMFYHQENTFLFCLKSNVEPFPRVKAKGKKIRVNHNKLEKYLAEMGVYKIEEWVPNSKPNDHDGDIYSNRIYRAYISPDKLGNISTVRDGIMDYSVIHSSEYENKHRLLYSPNDPNYQNQCSLPAMKANLAWDYFIDQGMPIGNRRVLLASVDTGVDYTHPDLTDNIWINQAEIPTEIFSAVDSDGDQYVTSSEVVAYLSGQDLNSDGVVDLQDALHTGSPFVNSIDEDLNGYKDDLIGWDFSGWSGTDDNDPIPKPGVGNGSTWAHGTHVAGILGATSDNNLGIASTAFNASVIAVKASRENQTDEPGINDGYAGLVYAAQAGFDAGTFTIINLSWGGGGKSDYEQRQINIAHDKYGAVIVAAAGNGDDLGNEEYEAHYPSSYDNVISVAAMGCSGNWGHWASYHETVDLSAPGESVLSTIIGTGYQSWGGSSMASPNAASSIGLLKAFYPEWDNTQLEERILSTADDSIYEENPEDYLQGRLGLGMVDVYNAIGAGYSPDLTYYNHIYLGDDDKDGILNPGESVKLRVLLQNGIDRVVAQNITGVLRSGPGIIFSDSMANYFEIKPGSIGNNISDSFEFTVSNSISLGDIVFTLFITANGENNMLYQTQIDFTVSVTLNQAGWPLVNESQVESSPAIADIDNDGEIDIIFGDYDGNIHRVDRTGAEAQGFPFITGDDVWGAPVLADVDLDGDIEIIVTSKSKHLYILNTDGTVQLDYDAGQYLMASPAVGNLDDDPELEIVIGGYYNGAKIFAINHDGTNVPGFPYEVGEKVRRGVALADFNGNGKDDIVFGTNSDNIWLIYDDGTLASGFPFSGGNDFRSGAVVVKHLDELTILMGSRDDKLYGVNGDGTERFSLSTGGDINASPAVTILDGAVKIFVGSADGYLYGIDLEGQVLPGWPKNLGNAINSAPVISDLDNDGSPEIICVNRVGKIFVFHINGESYANFPIGLIVSTKSTPSIGDIDQDGNLEILFGTVDGVHAIDIKQMGTTNSYWSTGRGNLRRNGYYDTDLLSNAFTEEIPTSYLFSPGFPNPFNSVISFHYTIPEESLLKITIFNIAGQIVDEFDMGLKHSGRFKFSWNADRFSSGLYFIRFQAESSGGGFSFNQVVKMSLIK